MNNLQLEEELQEMLLPVLGLERGEIQAESSLVKDLGAESLDFVEIVYLIEKKFGVVLENSEIIAGGAAVPAETLFRDGKLSEEGEKSISGKFSQPERVKAGMTKMELFCLITVRDLANIVKMKLEGGGK
ncbi:MAG: phosphopantetheine-binding protein [Sporomusaceae bacterium]|jgi:acyl carrier protein|nr:phosphopantetheine-binding protein [Sporomusaceae bacterium]